MTKCVFGLFVKTFVYGHVLFIMLEIKTYLPTIDRSLAFLLSVFCYPYCGEFILALAVTLGLQKSDIIRTRSRLYTI